MFSLQHLLGDNEREMQKDQSVIQQLRAQMDTVHANCGMRDATQRSTEFNSYVLPKHFLPNTLSVHSLHSGKVL